MPRYSLLYEQKEILKFVIEAESESKAKKIVEKGESDYRGQSKSLELNLIDIEEIIE